MRFETRREHRLNGWSDACDRLACAIQPYKNAVYYAAFDTEKARQDRLTDAFAQVLASGGDGQALVVAYLDFQDREEFSRYLLAWEKSGKRPPLTEETYPYNVGYREAPDFLDGLAAAFNALLNQAQGIDQTARALMWETIEFPRRVTLAALERDFGPC